MEFTALVTLIVFVVAIGLIIWGKWDSTVIGLLAVVLMVVLRLYTEAQAFSFVDWNVIIILFSIWIIAVYFGKSGVPQYLAVTMMKISGNNVGLLFTLIGIIAGFISMFVDNIVVILMFAPVILHLTKQLKLKSFPFIIFLGLCANFMGTALLLGDLPPQMLHSVSGIEFNQFVWHLGRPSSFILLTITYLVTVAFMYRLKYRNISLPVDAATVAVMAAEDPKKYLKKRSFVTVSLGLFLVTVVAMAFRQVLDLKLGFIALAGMVVLVIINEVFSKQLESPSFEDVLKEIDWKALMFYILLFVLVGGLEHAGIIQMVANVLAHYFEQSYVLGATLLYWVTAPIVGVVEHDAYILAFLYLIRDLAASTGFSPWPLWWSLLWAGTLGSNLTIAGAPALFVARSICEREENTKIQLKEFLSYSVPFVLVSLIVQYILALVFWIIPFAK